MYIDGTEEKYFIQALQQPMDGKMCKCWTFDNNNHLFTDYGFEKNSVLLDQSHIGEDSDGLKFFANTSLNFPNASPFQTLEEKHPNIAEKCVHERNWPVLRISQRFDIPDLHGMWMFHVDTVTYDQWSKCRFHPDNIVSISTGERWSCETFEQKLQVVKEHPKTSWISWLFEDFVRMKRNEIDIRTYGLTFHQVTASKPWEYFTLNINVDNTQEKYFIQITDRDKCRILYRGWTFDDKNHIWKDTKLGDRGMLRDTRFMGDDKDGLNYFTQDLPDFTLDYERISKMYPERVEACIRERDWPVLYITQDVGGGWTFQTDSVTYDKWSKCRFNPREDKFENDYLPRNV